MRVETSNWKAFYFKDVLSVVGYLHACDEPAGTVCGSIETRPSLCLYDSLSEDVTVLRLCLVLTTHVNRTQKVPHEGHKLLYYRATAQSTYEKYDEVHIFYNGLLLSIVPVTDLPAELVSWESYDSVLLCP